MYRFLRHSQVPALILAAILAAGAITVWGIAVGISGGALLSWLYQKQVYEHLQITYTGQPLIVTTYRSHRTNTTMYCSLDRQQVDLATLRLDRAVLSATRLAARSSARAGEFDGGSIGSHVQTNPTPTNWYFVRDWDRAGNAYLVGYDLMTNDRVGYLGLGGFRLDEPPTVDQFVLSPRESRSVTATQIGTTRGRAPRVYDERAWIIAVISAEQLYLVNLSDRTVKQIPLAEPALAVSLLRAPVETEGPIEDIYRIALRTPEHLLILDPDGKTLRTLLIPPPLADEAISLYLPLGGEIILGTSRSQPGASEHPNELYWVDPSDHVTRHESYVLRASPDAPTPLAWLAASIAPSPAPLFLFGYGILPHLARTDSEDLAAQRALICKYSWPAFLVVCVLSLVLAAVTYRRQLRYGPRGAFTWTAFVLLLGAPGFLGYLWHRRWPVLESCAACGANVPRDRDACRACHAEFVAPAIVGNEVMA